MMLMWLDDICCGSALCLISLIVIVIMLSLHLTNVVAASMIWDHLHSDIL
jgi:hypothetical protein